LFDVLTLCFVEGEGAEAAGYLSNRSLPSSWCLTWEFPLANICIGVSKGITKYLEWFTFPYQIVIENSLLKFLHVKYPLELPYINQNITTENESCFRWKAVNFNELSPRFLFPLFHFVLVKRKIYNRIVYPDQSQTKFDSGTWPLFDPFHFKALESHSTFCDLNSSLPGDRSGANECQQQAGWSTHSGISRSRFMTPTWPSWPVSLHVLQAPLFYISWYPLISPIPWNVCNGESFVRSSPAESSWTILLLVGSAFRPCNEPQRVLNFE